MAYGLPRVARQVAYCLACRRGPDSVETTQTLSGSDVLIECHGERCRVEIDEQAAKLLGVSKQATDHVREALRVFARRVASFGEVGAEARRERRARMAVRR